MQYRVVVNANNFATGFQRYSLAILGCLSKPTDSPSAAPQGQGQGKSLDSTKSATSCPDSELFELELTTAADGENKMIWDLINPTENQASNTIISGPDASQYQENETYYYSACLQPNRYRFKMLNIGGASYKLTIGGEEVLDSASLNHPSNLYSFRFRMTASGYAPIARTRTRPQYVVP